MTKEELEKEAEEWVISNTEIYDDKLGIEREEEPKAKEAYLAGAEPREKRIAELEKQLEELPDKWCRNKDDYCPHLAKLEQENALLKGRNEGFEQQIMGLLIKYEEVYKRFPDLKSAMDKAKTILKENAELKERANILDNCDRLGDMITQAYKDQLTKAKELLKEMIDTPVFNQMGGEVYENECYTELVAEVENFLSEVEK